jgi:hypothetical protein
VLELSLLLELSPLVLELSLEPPKPPKPLVSPPP